VDGAHRRTGNAAGLFSRAPLGQDTRMSTPNASSQHIVAVIGGATAGAEVASRLAEAGIRVVVFEMNPRPYGKIEDGLPRWHHGLRHKEYETIGEKLSQAGVEYVPNTKIGRDIAFEALARDWGFSAVILANGAWRDRPLPVEGAEQYVGKGLIYQNPFIIWFNHFEETSYAGERYVPEDGALIVDFNYAHNPYCAYNERWSCPITPAENHIPVPIRAGEKAPGA